MIKPIFITNDIVDIIFPLNNVFEKTTNGWTVIMEDNSVLLTQYEQQLECIEKTLETIDVW